MERDTWNFSRKGSFILLLALCGILTRLGAEPVWQVVPQKNDILPNPKGTVSLLEKADRYEVYLQFPGRDLSKVMVNLQGGILHVEAPSDGSLPRVRRDISIEGASRDGSLSIDRSVSRSLLVVTVPKEGGDPQTNTASSPTARHLQDARESLWQEEADMMISEMRRMQRDMVMMMEGFSEIPMSSLLGFFPERNFENANRGGSPSIEDAGDRYVVRVSLPGQDLSKVDVNLRGRLLTIEARNDARVGSGGLRMSRGFQYSQAMNLPGPVLVGKMKVDRRGDELVVTLPKLGS